jgi:toxin ParE1/3/4
VKWRVVVRPRAEIDLKEARDWYEKQRAGLGHEFLAQIAIAIQLLAEDPELHPEYYRGFRRALTRRFPYKVFYRIESKRIIVFRLLHARRNHSRLLD